MEHITSRTNPLCTHLRKLAASASYRRSCGEFLCDSPKLLGEALLWGADLRTVVCTDPSALPALPVGRGPAPGAHGAGPLSYRFYQLICGGFHYDHSL